MQMANRLIVGILTKDFESVVRTHRDTLFLNLLGVLQVLPCFLVSYYVSAVPWDADAFRCS
jgi:hypothetical protein